MHTRPSTKLARAHRVESAVFAILGGAALLCVLLAVVAPLHLPPPEVALPPPPVLAQRQVTAYPPQWQADLRTAYHAALYLLDPRV